MIHVLVVPEKSEFKKDLFYGEVVYINKNLGEPGLDKWNAKYLAPYFIEDKIVERIYEILEMRPVGSSYEIYLGNSYLLKNKWNRMSQHRSFEYHPLDVFGFKEFSPGYLIPL